MHHLDSDVFIFLATPVSTIDTSSTDALYALIEALEHGSYKRITTALQVCRDSFEDFSIQELTGLAIVFAESEAGETPVSFEEIRFATEEVYMTQVQWENVLPALQDKGAVTLMKPDGTNINAEDLVDAEYDLEDEEGDLAFCTIKLRLTFTEVQSLSGAMEGSSNQKYLRDSLHYLDAMIEYAQIDPSQSALAQRTSLDEEYDRIRAMTNSTQAPPPLEVLCRVYRLGRIDWTLIVLALSTELRRNTITPIFASELLYSKPHEKALVLKHLRPNSTLVRSGIVYFHVHKKSSEEVFSIPLDLIQYLICEARPPFSIQRKMNTSASFVNQRDYFEAWVELAQAIIGIG